MATFDNVRRVNDRGGIDRIRGREKPVQRPDSDPREVPGAAREAGGPDEEPTDTQLEDEVGRNLTGDDVRQTPATASEVRAGDNTTRPDETGMASTFADPERDSDHQSGPTGDEDPAQEQRKENRESRDANTSPLRRVTTALQNRGGLEKALAISGIIGLFQTIGRLL